MTAFIVIAWIATGVLGGHLLRYPDDGLPPYILGAMMGPIALLLAIHERVWPD